MKPGWQWCVAQWRRTGGTDRTVPGRLGEAVPLVCFGDARSFAGRTQDVRSCRVAWPDMAAAKTVTLSTHEFQVGRAARCRAASSAQGPATVACGWVACGAGRGGGSVIRPGRVLTYRVRGLELECAFAQPDELRVVRLMQPEDALADRTAVEVPGALVLSKRARIEVGMFQRILQSGKWEGQRESALRPGEADADRGARPVVDGLEDFVGERVVVVAPGRMRTSRLVRVAVRSVVPETTARTIVVVRPSETVMGALSAILTRTRLSPDGSAARSP